MWQHTGRQRPAFAIEPAPGQESVWDYPRPPRIVADSRAASKEPLRRAQQNGGDPSWKVPEDADTLLGMVDFSPEQQRQLIIDFALTTTVGAFLVLHAVPSIRR